MVGDQNHASSNNFEVLREGVGLADRGTFVLDPQGEIQLLEITPEGVGRNAAELMRKIKALQYWVSHPGEVCPAKWEEGVETLAPSLELVGKIEVLNTLLRRGGGLPGATRLSFPHVC